MNNHELDNQLRSAPVPERPPEFWENLPKQITKRLGEQERRDMMRSTNGAKRQARLMPVLWGVGLATACLALGFFWGLGRGRTISITEEQIAETKQYYEQVSGLFRISCGQSFSKMASRSWSSRTRPMFRIRWESLSRDNNLRACGAS